mgnify:CR=1 FL=1
MQALPGWLEQRAFLTPEKPALIGASGEVLTWAGLHAAASAGARLLRAAGLAPGDRVAILAGNGLPFCIAVHALAEARLTAVPVNTRLAGPEVAFQLKAAGVAAVLADAARESQARALSDRVFSLEELASLSTLPGAGKGTPKEPERTRRVLLDDPQGILFTSGTTGSPKGAVLTFGNHWWSAIGSALRLGLRPDDRWLLCLPLFHVGGLSILMRGVICGIPAVVHERFDPEQANRAIDREGVTIVSAVSQMLERMLDARRDAPFPPSLRCVLTGGGPVPAPLLERCARLGVPVVQTYGLTETASQAATLAPEEALVKLGSAGKPLFCTEIKVDAPKGEVGEIWVRGPNVSPGYATPTGIDRRDGDWLRTGDLGRLDEDGYLYVAARREDLIISGGENVYPAEVESVLKAHPGVLDAGVVGRDDPRWGQVPVAFVVARPGRTVKPEELAAFCRERLAKYKVPVAFVAAGELPKNASGKLLRRVLRDAAAGEKEL